MEGINSLWNLGIDIKFYIDRKNGGDDVLQQRRNVSSIER